MATSSQLQETPEYRTFREHYSKLLDGIQDPLSLAAQLYSKAVIDRTVLQRVNISALPTFQNTHALLSAVEGKIRYDSHALHKFLSALKEDVSMQSLVESMEG